MTIKDLINGHATNIFSHSTEGDIFRIARNCYDDAMKKKLLLMKKEIA